MQKIINAADKNRALILEAEQYIWANAETGYREYKTSKYMEEKFLQLGYKVVKADGITGFYAQLDTGREGPLLLILCELDSVICPAHKAADSVTGAVHSCGHNAQCAALLGIAAALKEPDTLDGLCGRIRLCAVPAEELLEIEFRSKLKKEGRIKYFSGKCEFLSRGFFDGVDLALMVHVTTESFAITGGAVGCVTKSIIYKGTAAHAGGNPWDGRNALYAANCGINAVNAIRETFRDTDLIRVHPIITHGGDTVNAIPEAVTLESYVRGISFKAIADANKKVNNALTGAALSLGTNIEIIDVMGYAPLTNDKNMAQVAKEAFYLIEPDGEITVSDHISTGSTDMGDLSCLYPVIHPYVPGARGMTHGKDYEIADPQLACVTNAKWQLAMVWLLLSNNAQRAKKIIAEYKPQFTSKEEYLRFVDSLSSSGDRIIYNKDGKAQVKTD